MLAISNDSYGQKGSSGVSNGQVKQIISSWPAKPKEVANVTINKYGNADEATATMLIWHNNGSWKKTILCTEKFLMISQSRIPTYCSSLFYKAPIDRFDELAAYDGSVVVERTNGEMSARCDKEEMNFLALNLANDVATGKKTANEARMYYARAAMAFMKGEKDPCTQGVQFTVLRCNTGEKDMPAKM